jgi:dolichyl-diphosphooligosaccharide--protein glycosyltransferase
MVGVDGACYRRPVSTSPRRNAWSIAAGLALVMLGGAAVRLMPVREVLGGPQVRILGDGDGLYHLWRAQQIAASWPRPNWFDPLLDYPYGARIPWPPLFDEVIATSAVLTPGGAAPDHVARVAAVVPVVLAIATLPLVAALAATLVGGSGLSAALIVALVPAAAYFGSVGLTDHHVAELLLFCASMLAFVRSWSSGALRRGPALLLGLVLALSFWNWPGSALTLLVLAACAAANHVAEPEGEAAAARMEQALGVGAAGCAALLLGSIAAWGPPGALRSFDVTGIGGLSVVLSASVGAGCASLIALRRLRRGEVGPARRAGEIVVAGLLASALALAVPGVARGILNGVTAARAGNTWYESIAEFRPALFSGDVPVLQELAALGAVQGLCLLSLPLAAWAMASRWKLHPARRQRTLCLATFGAALLVLAFARSRFILYASVGLALWASIACRAVAARLTSRWRGRWGEVARVAAIAVGSIALVAPAYVLGGNRAGPAVEPEVADLVDHLSRLRDAAPAGDRAAVLAPWTAGHAFRTAGHPVVASPFGTDTGRRGLEDEAAFYLATDPQDAEQVLARRRVRFVVVTSPVGMADALRGFVPPGRAPPVEVRRDQGGRTVVPTEGFSRTMLARLFFGDGMPPRSVDEPSWGCARLVREELPPTPTGVPDRTQVKTFEVVPGAVLRVLGASTRVAAEASVTTNTGRRFQWRTFGDPSDRGVAELIVPYATGSTGDVGAGAWTVRSGSRVVTVAVPPGAPERGDAVVVDLDAAAPP